MKKTDADPVLRSGVPARLRRNRIGSFVGTSLLLVTVLVVLLAFRELWDLQAAVVGRVLDSAGVVHDVVTGPQAPVILTQGSAGSTPGPVQAVATLAVLAAAMCAVAVSRRLPAMVKGATAAVAVVVAGTVALHAWAPGAWPQPGELSVDWKTSAVVPVIATVVLFSWTTFALPGNPVLTLAWCAVGAAATVAASVLRLSLAAAGHAALGDSWGPVLHLLAAMFWDLPAGVAVLAAAHLTAGFRLLPRPRVVP